jgi:hypothetical protein
LGAICFEINTTAAPSGAFRKLNYATQVAASAGDSSLGALSKSGIIPKWHISLQYSRSQLTCLTPRITVIVIDTAFFSTLRNSVFCPHSFPILYTIIYAISLHSITRLTFVIETDCVLCEEEINLEYLNETHASHI